MIFTTIDYQVDDGIAHIILKRPDQLNAVNSLMSKELQLLQPSLSHCLAIDDAAVAPLMAKFADGTIGGMPIEAGECATSGLAALLAAKQDPPRWQQLGLSADSVILLIGTEGATDADIYAELTAAGQS